MTQQTAIEDEGITLSQAQTIAIEARDPLI